MAKITINLLPLEFREQDLKNAKFYKVQIIGIAIVLLMIFLSSLTVALRILQGQTISQIQSQLSQSEQRISNLKNTQASLLLLKSRLATINQYLGTPSLQTQNYKIINKLFPPSISISSISIGNGGEILILANAPDGSSVDSLITNLTSKDNNEDKISQISLENINRGKDGIYRLSLKVKTK